MSKSFFLGANWKMQPVPEGAFDTGSPYRSKPSTEVVVFPTFLDLQICLEKGLICGAQCARPEPSGAFTGDVSMAMLKTLGIRFVLCGHSERRKYHGETDKDIATQVSAAIAAGLTPIFCIGETAVERGHGQTEEVLKRQLETVLDAYRLPLTADRFILAYEPIWAISGGDPNKPAASTADAERAHRFIRSLLPPERQASTQIIYGGSMKAANALELLKQPDIDGGLIGGASLKPKEFAAIVEAARKLARVR